VNFTDELLDRQGSMSFLRAAPEPPGLPDATAADTGNDPLLTRAAIDGASPRDQVAGRALVLRSDLRLDRAGKSYAAMSLRCADGGTCEARWWRFPYGPDRCPREGVVYRFAGRVDTYNGERQLCITEAHEVADADLSPFAPAIQRPRAQLETELAARIAALDPDVGALVTSVLSGEVYARYSTWPAAQRHHGALRHGLLAHSVRVACLVTGLCDAYGPEELPCDRSVAIAAALLHDVGKTHTLPAIPGSALPEAAARYDHVTLGTLIVRSAAAQLEPPFAPERLDALLHAILAHHGRKEWGAPIEPQTPEAWLVHLADLAEARLWSYTPDAGWTSPPNTGGLPGKGERGLVESDELAYASSTGNTL
jgi:3'-5' exoribonuclease